MFLLLLSAHIAYINRYVPSEEFPEDIYLSRVEVKKALVISAHDDDICAMSGTISKLNKAGWEIKQLCFDSKDRARNAAHLKAASYIMDEALFIDLGEVSYRKLHDSIQYSWMPIPKESFPLVYQKDLVKKYLVGQIVDFKPSIIFSLDNVLGGYGHPDHTFISDLIVEICKEDKRSVKKIYQSVFPDSYEAALFPDLDNRAGKYPSPYFTAKQMYKIDGMPEPHVQINIYDNSWKKKMFLSTYLENERKNIRKFLPAYEYYPHWFYFWLFDKEYFRVIEF
ncbi:hypothetical protein MATR_08160 [Marivirga tractuosa]|uniref:LmbE family protein n=2 Tax=Marivirga TaxID=869806 RepID=E4TPG6_MARTH|nr:LmbE family protein [Marivirga tractuosa DSM 4126]BDD13991.1 hypothetical protein MATR_08160 [Marivirga tractuosa]